MGVPRRILCPVDFSPASERALAHAIAWARTFGSELHVLHVIVDVRDDPGAAPLYEGVLRARAALENWIERNGAGDLACRGVVRATSVGGSVAEHAIEAGIDLVVLGSHGRRGPRSRSLGSQCERVARDAPCPVLVIPAAELAPAAVPRRTLVPLDFGPRAAPALRYAKELSGACGGSLLLLHVLEAAAVPDFFEPLGRALFQREPAARRQSIERLQRLFWDAGGPLVPFDVRVVDGRTETDIERVAAEVRADAIVLPAHRLATDGRLLGSTADRVLCSARRPVLIHREVHARRERPFAAWKDAARAIR